MNIPRCIAELTRALKQMGFKVGDVWFKIPANQADDELS